MVFPLRQIIDALLPSNLLKSIDFGTVVDALAEGQIEGSATASKARITDKTSTAFKNAFLKDLFLNKTAVLQGDASNTNPNDSEFNYQKDKITFEFQDGTANNSVLNAAAQQISEVSTGDKNQECSFPVGGSATPRSATITNTDVDFVQVKAKFDQFFRVNTENGNRESTSVQVLIKVNPNNGNAQNIIQETVSGKSFNPYNRDFGIDLQKLSGFNRNTAGASGSFFPIVVSIERENDVGDENTFNRMRLAEVRQIINEKNNYPNIAYSSLRFSSELFTSAPSRVFRVRGKLVKIPHNATVDYSNGRLTYSGTFDGSFKTDKEWTSDPAWCLFDLLTDSISGCGIPETELDPFTFFGVSKYCSELVDDGNGGQEPRFSLNVNIQSKRDAMAVIKDICSVMRATPFYEEGVIKIAQDAPQDINNPSAVSFNYVFNNTNVVNGDFIYSGSSAKTRFNVINVSYFDLETQEIDYVTVKDSSAQSKFGTQTKTITTFGITSRGQAQRVGKWFLNTQQTQTETVAFETNIAAGSVLRIGDIIGISDRVKAATRRGGLVKAATVSQVTLDDVTQTNLPSLNDSPTISCMLSDGTVEQRNISTIGAGVINVATNFTSVPVINSPFIIESGSLLVQSFRVLNIKENDKKTFSIVAVIHNSGKYAAVEDGESLPVKNINLLTSLLPSPQIIDGADGSKAIEEKIVLNNNRPVPKLFIDWQTVDGASGYQLIYRKDNENPIVVTTQQSEHEILPSESGSYNIQIYTLNSNGERSASPTEKIIDTVGLTAVPENPTNFEIEPLNNSQVKLSWTKTTSLDVEFGGNCVIRHTPDSLAQATFENSTDLNENINGSTNEIILPALTGTYSLKFRDLGGRLSTTEAKVELSLPEMQDELLIKSQREQTAFSGSKTNLSVVSNALQLTNPANNLTGTYEFASVLDLGSVFTNVRLKRHIKSEGFNVSDLFDSIADLDARLNFDGAGSERLKSKLQVQTSTDNNTFTTLQTLTNGSFVGRSFKFTSNLISLNANENIKFIELGFDAFLPSRTENKYQSSGNIISTPLQSGTSASGLAVVFGKPFFTGTSDIGGSTTAFLPSISIAPEDMPSGAFFTLSSISGQGFTVVFKNSSNTPIDVKFSFQALGYGKGA